MADVDSIILNAGAFFSALGVAVLAFFALVPLVGAGFSAFLRQKLAIAFRLLPERKMTWGTVYDSDTKRPIPYAKVQLLDAHRRVLETRIADRDGRYGFLAASALLHESKTEIFLIASAPGYVFPSHTAVTVDNLLYDHLYYGAPLKILDQELINADIPLDPMHISLRPLLVKSPSIAVGTSAAVLADVCLWVGAVFVPLSVIFSPNPFTFGTLFVFLGTASLRLFGVRQRPFGIIYDVTTRAPLPFALITLNNSHGKRISFAVSDEQGRYFLAVPPGSYDVIVVTPAHIVPPRTAHITTSSSRGWLTQQITI